MKRCRICLCELSAHQSIGQWLWMTDVLCRDCRARFVRVKEPLQIQDLCVHALYRYDDFLEGLLFQFKEGRDIALAPIFFAPWMQWLELYRHHHWVLMPSSDEKCEERGFFSLREMLKQSGQVLYEPLYKRTNFKQSTRSGNERRQVMNEIEQKQEYPLPRGDLLLIDDVCTTGATLQRAYQLLRPHSNTIEAVVLCAHPLLLAHREENRLQWFQRRGRSWKER